MLHVVETIPTRLAETAAHLTGPVAEVLELEGPIAGRISYKSFRITLHILRPGPPKMAKPRGRAGMPVIFMQIDHGHGTERFRLVAEILQDQVDTLLHLPAPALFGLFYELWFCRREAEAVGYHQAAERYGKAFVAGRLRSRPSGTGNGDRVWIAEGVDRGPGKRTIH